jgi:hypothetical protein
MGKHNELDVGLIGRKKGNHNTHTAAGGIY